MPQESVRIRRSGHHIVLINDTLKAGLEIEDWESAIEFAHILAWQARGVLPPHRQQVTLRIAIRREDTDMVIEYGGHTFLTLPCKPAIEVANAIIFHAHQIESELEADAIAFDQALILRTGALPFGLTDNPAIQEMAGVEAAWNTTLRKALPGTVKIQQHVGVPIVHKLIVERGLN